ncbi:MAG: transposase [Candidatus Methylumidiphilus sp.]
MLFLSGKNIDLIVRVFGPMYIMRREDAKGFVLLSRRWVAERTFGRIKHSRRLGKSYERLTRTDENWVYIAMARIMPNRLA